MDAAVPAGDGPHPSPGPDLDAPYVNAAKFMAALNLAKLDTAVLHKLLSLAEGEAAVAQQARAIQASLAPLCLAFSPQRVLGCMLLTNLDPLRHAVQCAMDSAERLRSSPFHPGSAVEIKEVVTQCAGLVGALTVRVLCNPCCRLLHVWSAGLCAGQELTAGTA